MGRDVFCFQCAKYLSLRRDGKSDALNVRETITEGLLFIQTGHLKGGAVLGDPGSARRTKHETLVSGPAGGWEVKKVDKYSLIVEEVGYIGIHRPRS